MLSLALIGSAVAQDWDTEVTVEVQTCSEITASVDIDDWVVAGVETSTKDGADINVKANHGVIVSASGSDRGKLTSTTASHSLTNELQLTSSDGGNWDTGKFVTDMSLSESAQEIATLTSYPTGDAGKSLGIDLKQTTTWADPAADDYKITITYTADSTVKIT